MSHLRLELFRKIVEPGRAAEGLLVGRVRVHTHRTKWAVEICGEVENILLQGREGHLLVPHVHLEAHLLLPLPRQHAQENVLDGQVIQLFAEQARNPLELAVEAI